MAGLWGDTLPSQSLWGDALPPAPSYSTPSNLDSIIETAAKKHNIDPKLLRAVGEKESNLGKGLDKTGRGDSGHGYGVWQLDDQRYPGTTPRDPALLERARSDPAFAADYAAGMLASNIKQHGLRGGVRAYNGAGKAADAYAEDVLAHYGHDTTEADFRNRSAGKQTASKASANPLIDAMRSLNQPIVGAASAAETKPQASLWESTLPQPNKMAAMTKKPKPDYGWDEQLGGAITTVTQTLPGAVTEGRFGDLAKMITDGDFAGAKDEFGFFRKAPLQRSADKGNAYARWLLDHPKVVGGVQFAADWFDPLLNLTGKGIGKVLGVGFRKVAELPEGRAFLNAFSPLRDIASAGGETGKRAMQALLTHVASAPADAQRLALSVFGGLGKREQEDVVHAFQGEHLNIKTQDPVRLAKILERADLLHTTTEYITNKQVDVGTLIGDTAEANPIHFGMGGAHENTELTEQQRTILKAKSGLGGNVTREKTEGTEQKYKTLALAQFNSALEKDFHVVTQAEKNFGHGLKNSAFETYAAKLPTTLLIQGAEHVVGHPPKDGAGIDMVHFKDIARDNPSLAKLLEFSPVLSHAYISGKLVAYLEKNATRMYDDSPLYPTGKDAFSTVARNGLKAYDSLNTNARMAIISNPIYHPLWNLSNNAMGAGLPLSQVASLVTKSVVNTLGGGKWIDKFEKRVGQDYTKGLASAMEAGALAEMKSGGSESTRRLAAQYKDLDASGKFGKFIDNAQAWNNRLTFGKRGEQAFSVALFNHLMKKLPDTDAGRAEAAGLVREALGNYQNVSKDALQSRIVFFYPWMKGNIAFWMRKSVTNPKAVYAPGDAARANNDIVDTPDTPRAAYGQFDIKNGSGKPDRYTPMLPQRAIREPLTIAQGLAEGMRGGDLSPAVQAATQMVSKNLQPLPGLGFDIAATSLDSKSRDPANPMNFSTAWDKGGTHQLQELGMHALGRVAPIPLIGFPTKDALRTGRFDMKAFAMSAIGMGYIRSLEDNGEQASLNKLQSRRDRVQAKLRQAKKTGAIGSDDYRALRKQTDDAFQQGKAYVIEASKRNSNGVKPAPATPQKPPTSLWEDTLK